MFNLRLLTYSVLLVLLLAGCAPSAESCPSFSPVDLSEAEVFASDENLTFRFPLDSRAYTEPIWTYFAAYDTITRVGSPSYEYHAAEDYIQPAGTPVYAIADGNISFSGPMGGYGWLIIIDHPQANLYSLYGHLSPSRWRIESGTVEKGELIGYLGDSDENGGSAEDPLEPHLHFGIRSGQRTDYPGMGEWRWQAGWIKPCPQDLGWLQPSVIITSQDVPTEGFPIPAARLVEKWGEELLITGIYMFGGVSSLIYAIKKDKLHVLFISGGLLIVGGFVLSSNGTRISYALFAMGVLLAVIGIYQYFRRSTKIPPTQ
jgi:hypothetical protein